MTHLLDMSSTDLQKWLVDHAQGAYRLGQLTQWVYEGRAETFDEMSNLPKSLRESLSSELRIWTTRVVRHQQSDDGTEKLLLELSDGGRIESVLLRDGQRRTICISSQVGCAMGCVFCASGLDGVDRNLTAGEIIEQMLRLQRLLPREERLSHIVVMGMGEPLANLSHVLRALDVARDPQGLGISARRITISTVGLPPAMRRLATLNPGYQLAVSLHAPNDALRDQLVPTNSKTGIKPILDAADEYFHVSGRRLTFEYVLLGGINDKASHASKLSQLLRGRAALLNLIPYNPVAGLPYCTPKGHDLARFRQILESNGINVQVRERKGDRIQAACGQLRRLPEPQVYYVANSPGLDEQGRV